MLERRSVLPFSSSGRPHPRRRSRLLATGAAGALTVGLVGLAAPAGAATVTVPNWGYLQFTAGAGEVNDVLVERVGEQVRITDSGVDSLTGPSDCTSTGNALTCPLSTYYSIAIDLGDEADTAVVENLTNLQVHVAGGEGADDLRGTGFAVTLDGGEGDDTVQMDSGSDENYWWWWGYSSAVGGPGDDAVTGGPHSEALSGGAGDDVVLGGGGNDVLFAHDSGVWSGGTDSDRLDGGAGDDQLQPGGGSGSDFRGGEGRDLLQYAPAPRGVEVSLDDVADDGSAGQGDNAHSDIELLTGSNFDDVLVGSSARDEISGLGGADRLDGMAGRDRLDGGAGDDVVDGGAGDDRLVTPTGADDLGGGEGTDSLDLVRSGDVTVRPNGLADDGLAGEELNVRGDVEEIATGDGDDLLIGSATDNEFSTGGGDDVVQGRGGNDGLDGGRGRDDVLGGRGTDTLVGGAGVDTLDSADGRADAVSCGGSTDTLTRDRRDQVSPDCELAG